MNRTTQLNRIGLAPLLGLALALLVVLSLAWEGRSTQAALPAQTSGPDLTASIRVEPAIPDVGEEVRISVTVENIGGSATAPGEQVEAWLYINPPDDAPDDDTPGAFPLISIPGLPAGGNTEASRTHIFADAGCHHRIYVWVNPQDKVTESNTANNMIMLPLCVGVKCELDDYESDDSAESALTMAPGAHQERSFCRTVGDELTPTGDQDWIKLTAFAGLTYTLSTDNTQLHADPRIVLYSGGLLPIGGPAPQVSWQPPVNGLYYARITNAEDSDGSGPLTRYDLSLAVQADVTDAYEPDDTCGQAREIPTNGQAQTRLFQTPGDVDWIKFSVQAGESFAVIADNRGPGVNPIITLFDSCQQARSLDRVAQGTPRVEARSAADQIYYAHVVNQNPERFGADASYDLRVAASACTPDDFENDDSLGQAQALALNDVQTRNFCPAGDEDWVKFELEAGQIYVLKTANLGPAADTVLALFDADGVQIAENDDYDYVKASRIVYEAATSGVYYAMARHHNSLAAGDDTSYDLTLETGFCVPDEADAANGDNGPGDAVPVSTDGAPVERNFCADPLSLELGDQDWMRFSAAAGATYTIRTDQLGPNADTVLRLYDQNGFTLLAENDDDGASLASQIVFVAPRSGDYFVQVTQYNAAVVGREASYRLIIDETLPPPPPTPSPTPPPIATPPRPELDPADVKTLIVVNEARLETLHGAGPTADIFARLEELAGHEQVQGAILRVDQNPAVAAAYAAWTASDATLADNDLANQTAETIRNAILSFHEGAPDLAYLVLVGDDRAIPFLRVPEGNLAKKENEYAADVAALTIRAALEADMILTDDFYGTLEPQQRAGRELYMPDFAIGRLIQEPDEITGLIDVFLADPVIDTQRAFITGYDFVIDSAELKRNILTADGLQVADIIGPVWTGNDLRARLLEDRFEWISINGHSTHVASGVPNLDDITAEEILAAANDFTRTLVYSVGCHAGLNDADVLDLPQAFARRGANFVGNTGFGWGGGGVVFSEALMRNFTRELARETSAEIGPSLVEAKRAYLSRARTFGSYDAKILMQTTLYGLPMFGITSGGVFDDGNLFPGVDDAFTMPSPGAFGDDELAVGSFSFGLPGSFGSFGASEDDPNYRLQLETARDATLVFEAGAPIQPGYFRELAAPGVGSLRGVVFLGGVYTDTVAEAPLALAFNEYVEDTELPEFEADGWYPPVPFGVQSSAFSPGVRDTAVLALGQYDPASGTQRVFENMSFDTYYSDNPDRSLADIGHVDAVLDASAGKGHFKVDAHDVSGVTRVVIAYTEGQGQWESEDLAFDEEMGKWIGEIAATANTRYFVQVVDGAANVAVADNKGRYYSLQPPLPLAQGRQLVDILFVPMVAVREGE